MITFVDSTVTKAAVQISSGKYKFLKSLKNVSINQRMTYLNEFFGGVRTH